MWGTLLVLAKRMIAKNKLKIEQAKLEKHSNSLGGKKDNEKTRKLKREIKILNVTITISLAGLIAIIVAALLIVSYFMLLMGSLSGFRLLSTQQERITEEEEKDGWVWSEEDKDYIPPDIAICKCGCMKDYDYSTGNPGSGGILGSSGDGPYVDVPNDANKYGTSMTYMGYHMITGASNQRTLKRDAIANGRYSISDYENYAMIDGRILIATTPSIGGVLNVKIGDYIDVTFEGKDGATKVYKCIMGDQKAIGSASEPDITIWGHNYGKNVVEIIYHDYSNTKIVGNNPWGKGRTARLTLVGNYKEGIKNSGETAPSEGDKPSTPPLCKCTDHVCCNQINVPTTGSAKFSPDITKVPLYTNRTAGVLESGYYRRLPKIVNWTSNGIDRNGVSMDQTEGGDWNYNTAGGHIVPGSSCMVYAYAQAMTHITGTLVTVPYADQMGIAAGKLVTGIGSADETGTNAFAGKFGMHGKNFNARPNYARARSILEQLREPLAAGNTAVVFRGIYNSATGSGSDSHYITLVDYDVASQTYIVLDPARGLQAYKIDKFLTGTVRSIQLYTADPTVLQKVN